MSKRGEDRAYVRVSTQKESQQDSPEHQESYIKEIASRMNMEITKVYEDRDSATSIVDRTDVQEMIEDAKRGDIRTLFFVSITRFSRDAVDALSLKRILVNALKVRVISIEDNYDSGIKDDELLFGIKSVVSQNTSGDISISSRRGIRKSAESGNYTGTIPPYGYRKVTVEDSRMKSGKRKTLEVIPDQAEIVKKIFDLYVNGGMGEKAIVNYLNGDNEEGLSTPSYRGGLWGISSIQRILQNENYTGFTVYGRHTSEVKYNDLNNLMDRGKKLIQKPKQEWEKTKFQTHEAIVSKELFDSACETRLLRGGGERGGRRTFVNVFAKIMFCAECGTAMVTMSSLVRGHRYRYLMCSRRRRIGEKGCSNGKWIPYFEMRDELLNGLVDAIKTKLETMDINGIRAINSGLADNGIKKDSSKVEKKLADFRRLLFEVRRSNMLGDITDDQYEYEKALYEKDIASLENELARIEAREKMILDVEKNYADTQKALKELSSLETYDNVERTRSLIIALLQRIDVSKDGDIKMTPMLL